MSQTLVYSSTVDSNFTAASLLAKLKCIYVTQLKILLLILKVQLAKGPKQKM